MNSYKISGLDAIRLAERDNLTIHCFANPIDDGGIVDVGTARQIAKDDPSLIYVQVSARGWWDGQRMLSEMEGYNVADYFTSSGMYLGPDDDGIEPRWDDVELVKFNISTDAISATVEGENEDAAACKFAASEKLSGITSASDLIAHYEARDGWCKINEA